MSHTNDERFEAWWNHSEARSGLSEAAKGLCRSVWFAAMEDAEDQALKTLSTGRTTPFPTVDCPPPRCQACWDRQDSFYGSYAPPCPVHNDDGSLRAVARPCDEDKGTAC